MRPRAPQGLALLPLRLGRGHWPDRNDISHGPPLIGRRPTGVISSHSSAAAVAGKRRGRALQLQKE